MHLAIPPDSVCQDDAVRATQKPCYLTRWRNCAAGTDSALLGTSELAVDSVGAAQAAYLAVGIAVNAAANTAATAAAVAAEMGGAT